MNKQIWEKTFKSQPEALSFLLEQLAQLEKLEEEVKKAKKKVVAIISLAPSVEAKEAVSLKGTWKGLKLSEEQIKEATSVWEKEWEREWEEWNALHN